MIMTLSRVWLVLAVWCAPVGAQSLDESLVARVEGHVQQQLEEQALVGLSVAIGVDGELVWERGFGLADLENQVSASEDTVYRLASLSKPITAAAVMQLAERGQLDLDAPIQRYVPDWPDKAWPLSARQLLCHQGGVRHYVESDDPANTRAYATATAALDRFSSDPLLAEPGTTYHYSSYGYNLLGAAIEGASGMAYVDYLSRHVLPAAGTRDLQDDSQARIIENRARGYRLVEGEVQNATLVDTSYKVASGGLCGTAGDLVRFAQAMQSEQVVESASRDSMWTRQSTSNGVETDYGLGWFVGSDGSGRRIVRHGGAQTGAMASLVFFVDDGVVVAMLCNSEWCDPPRVVVPILKMVVNARR